MSSDSGFEQWMDRTRPLWRNRPQGEIAVLMREAWNAAMLAASPSPPEDGLVGALRTLFDRWHANAPQNPYYQGANKVAQELSEILSTHGHGGGEGR